MREKGSGGMNQGTEGEAEGMSGRNVPGKWSEYCGSKARDVVLARAQQGEQQYDVAGG